MSKNGIILKAGEEETVPNCDTKMRVEFTGVSV
ncbi:hypothetical protein RB151_014560 [Providencia rettgeri]|nr:hypothetical protein RB151_014560 [Providencia rettgeri]